MPILTRTALVVRIAEETAIEAEDVSLVITKTFAYIIEALAKGERVELRDFGVFKVRFRPRRIGRNPLSPDVDIVIPPRAEVKFTPGLAMSEAVVKISVATFRNTVLQSGDSESGEGAEKIGQSPQFVDEAGT